MDDGGSDVYLRCDADLPRRCAGKVKAHIGTWADCQERKVTVHGKYGRVWNIYD